MLSIILQALTTRGVQGACEQVWGFAPNYPFSQVYNLCGSREYPNVGWCSPFNKTASLFASECSWNRKCSFLRSNRTNQVSWIIKWLTDPGILNWVGQHQLEPVQGNHLKLLCYATVTSLTLFLHNSWISSLKDEWISSKPPPVLVNKSHHSFSWWSVTKMWKY